MCLAISADQRDQHGHGREYRVQSSPIDNRSSTNKNSLRNTQLTPERAVLLSIIISSQTPTQGSRPAQPFEPPTLASRTHTLPTLSRAREGPLYSYQQETIITERIR
jgi:hypothetical protein